MGTAVVMFPKHSAGVKWESCYVEQRIPTDLERVISGSMQPCTTTLEMMEKNSSIDGITQVELLR